MSEGHKEKDSGWLTCWFIAKADTGCLVAGSFTKSRKCGQGRGQGVIWTAHLNQS